jgi:hypothetical protein
MSGKVVVEFGLFGGKVERACSYIMRSPSCTSPLHRLSPNLLCFTTNLHLQTIEK